MVDWELSEHHLAIQDAARRFAQQEIAPLARDVDLQDLAFPEPLLKKMAEGGYFGMGIGPEWGGLGADTLAMGLVTEEFCRANLAMGSIVQRNWLCGHILETFGTPAQKQRWLPGMASGALQSCTSGTEPEAGSDAANIKTTARLDGDDYVVNGSKQWTTFAGRADLVFTYVRTSHESKHGGISLLVVEKTPGDDFAAPHLTGHHIRTVGFHGLPSYALFFDSLRVPRENLVGAEEGKAFYQLMFGYERARVLIGFRCIGLAQAAYNVAFRYAQDRVQFGRPIAEFQAVRHKLADMATDIMAARAFAHRIARTMDKGLRCNTEAGMVKLMCSEMAARVARTAMLLHGGNGYAIASDVNRYWRDSMLMSIGEGTSDIQREVIGKGLLKGD
jgi:alkylation response protein AidB-like acyl-CoA dehydrogenase